MPSTALGTAGLKTTRHTVHGPKEFRALNGATTVQSGKCYISNSAEDAMRAQRKCA